MLAAEIIPRDEQGLHGRGAGADRLIETLMIRTAAAANRRWRGFLCAVE